MTARVTWIMPVKNGMPYLPETLRSLREQTHRGAEILVWDNGSTDGTLEELARFVPGEIPGRVVTGRPSTVGGSLRRMVEEVGTEFCARIDADDVCLPDRLERELRFLDDNPEVAVVGTQIACIDATSAVRDYGMLPYPGSHEEIVLGLLCRNSMVHPTVVFRREAVLRAGNYSEVPNVEDYELWLRMAARGYRLHNLPEVLLRHRVHDGSTTMQAEREHRLRPLSDRCVIEQGPSLFGCPASELVALREKQHRVSLLPIVQVILRVARENRVSPLHLVRSRFISNGWFNVTQPEDRVSRVVLRAAGALGRALGA